MTGGTGRDAGQAFPAYVAVIAGLLFLAFVYFAVGQAATTRNGAQTAADAAALAAAQDAREQLRDRWLEVLLAPDQWGPYLRGEEYSEGLACESAASFAERNGAEIYENRCDRLTSGSPGFSVTVRTTGTVGKSVVPGTEELHAIASAEAVVEPLCTFDPPEPTVEPTPEPSTEPPPEPTETPPPEDEEEKDEPILGLTCGDAEWEIDPEAPTLPEVSDLFTVRLSD
ncbi:pilus assembly protein TadG-related protein [Streptomyces venezuelae]|uniref:pilus assembly protein TadG-related protein n=1 Tax=Streptomyces venezuelae TaxID=54571 RepID=UPI00278BDF62|nr:pilus assembly protein TadG-related protein [Streptomyces venezuelae]